MDANKWYTMAAGMQNLYFQPSGERCKNGSYKGVFVTVDLDRPRAKPRAKSNTVTAGDVRAACWKLAAEVPANVLAAAAAR